MELLPCYWSGEAPQIKVIRRPGEATANWDGSYYAYECTPVQGQTPACRRTPFNRHPSASADIWNKQQTKTRLTETYGYPETYLY